MPSKTDIDGHWAESEIKDAMLLGHIDASSTFRPKDGITRAEFAKMLCTVLDIDATKAVASYEEPFHDVKSSDWYYKYIVALYNNYGKSEKASAAQKGAIINGYEGDLFKPNAKITRQEAAKMLAAAYEVYNGLALTVNYNSQDKANGFEKSDITNKIDGIVDMTRKVNQETMHRDIKTSYVDDKDIASWADESVQTLKEEGIAGGNPDGTFKPKAEINRAEALLMIQRLATNK